MDYFRYLISAIFWIFASTDLLIETASPPSLRYSLPIVQNKILDTNLTCDSRNFNITIQLQYPFKGVVFAKDFSQACQSYGSLTNTVSINLPTSGCGVRLNSRKSDNGDTKRMFYSVNLIVQQDRYLQQITDQDRYFECEIDETAFNFNSNAISTILKNELKEITGRTYRNGRNQKHYDIDDSIGDKFEEALMAARAWMEIAPENKETQQNLLQVGEVALLTIKTTLPVGVGWKIVDCTAHDGLGDSSQKLLDENGCPIDEFLLPVPQLGPIQSISLMQHQEATARFVAFKFPDRDRLHISCGLELCRGDCVKIDCQSGDDNNSSSIERSGRILSKSERGAILDHLNIYNSVEVIAPAIDDLRKNRLQYNEPSTYPFVNLPGDRTFCVSPDKIALTFCILGVIFLIAVIIATGALYRARRSRNHHQQHPDGPFYTRSVFSSSSSTGSAYGSKLLLNQTNPCGIGGGQSRGLHYGRIL